MKFEFVEYYPWPKDKFKKNQKILGTCHIYVYDETHQFDLRGLTVVRKGKKIIVKLPFFTYVDDETKKLKLYPLFSFTKEADSKKLRNYLQYELPKEVIKAMKLQSTTEE